MKKLCIVSMFLFLSVTAVAEGDTDGDKNDSFVDSGEISLGIDDDEDKAEEFVQEETREDKKSIIFKNYQDSVKLTPAVIKKIQKGLNNGGYKLNVDGIFGPRTRAAIKGFQKKNNIAATGNLDSETVELLGL